MRVPTSPRVLVSGSALAPKGAVLTEQPQQISVVLEVETATDTIVDAAFAIGTDLAASFCKRLVVGYDLKQGIDPLARELAAALLLPVQPAVMMALRSAVQRYTERVGRDRQPGGQGQDPCHERFRRMEQSGRAGGPLVRSGREASGA